MLNAPMAFGRPRAPRTAFRRRCTALENYRSFRAHRSRLCVGEYFPAFCGRGRDDRNAAQRNAPRDGM